MTTKTMYESTADWLADKHGCGATTAYKLLAACPSSWGGPWTVWAQHHSPDWEPGESTQAMQNGVTWEDYVARWYDDHIIGEDDELYLDTQLQRIEASQLGGLPLRPSPDGLVYRGEQVIGGIDVKCPRYGWDDYAKDGEVIEAWPTTDDELPMSKGWLGRWREDYPCPLHYAVQVYVTMLALRLTGEPVEWYDLVVCFGPHDTRVIRFHYDEGVCQDLLRLLTEAWQDIVVEGNEPSPDETRQAWDYLLRRPRRKPPVRLDRTAEPQLSQDVVDYVKGHQQAIAWQKTKEALRVGILDEAARRGTEALEVEVLDKVYRVKVTATGRFYPKLIINKKEG